MCIAFVASDETGVDYSIESPGLRFYRARLVNRHTGVESITESVRLSAVMPILRNGDIARLYAVAFTIFFAFMALLTFLPFPFEVSIFVFAFIVWLLVQIPLGNAGRPEDPAPPPAVF